MYSNINGYIMLRFSIHACLWSKILKVNKQTKLWIWNCDEIGLLLYYLTCGYQYMVESMPQRNDEAERLKTWIMKAETMLVKLNKKT